MLYKLHRNRIETMSILTIIIDGIVDVYVGLFDLKRYRPV